MATSLDSWPQVVTRRLEADARAGGRHRIFQPCQMLTNVLEFIKCAIKCHLGNEKRRRTLSDQRVEIQLVPG